VSDVQRDREKPHELGVKLPRRRQGTRPPPLTRLRHRVGAARGSGSRVPGRGRWVDHFSSSRLQRSAVKVSYSRNGSKGTWAAHGRYLAREGAQREGERGKGFSASREDIDIPKELSRWQRAGDPRLFKLIVSPEAGGELDLREHARAVMRDVERDLGTPVEWVAIDHHNTDNPHVHIVLRGVDQAGKELRIDPDYVKSGFRQRSQEAATRVLGLRTERSLLSARERAVEKQQFTEIDRAILKRAGDDGIVRYDGPIPGSAARRQLRLLELRRLAVLSQMGLAERAGERSWQLKANLETALREFQRAHDVLKTRAKHRETISDPHAELVRTEASPGLLLTGKVVGTGLADEAADRRYVLLEGTDGRVHYVERPGDGASLRPGRIVTIAVTEEEARGRTVLRINVEEHGRLEDMQRKHAPSTALDREALRAVVAGDPLSNSTDARSFAATWRRAMRERFPVLERAGLVMAAPERGEGAYELSREGQRHLEALMKTLERELPSLEEFAAQKRRGIAEVDPEEGIQFRGRLVGYARDEDGREVAVVDVARELIAMRAEGKGLREGSDVRVRAESVEGENQRRRTLVWRITAERELDHTR
jgi:type IV secretory pathway VirD2 relaxase